MTAEDAPVEPSPTAPVTPVRPTPPARGSRLLAVVAAVALVAGAFGAGFLAGRGSAPQTADGGATSGASVAPTGSASGSGAPSPDGSAGATPVPTASSLAGLPHEGTRLGRADAKVTMDYWADYQCPFCARFAQDVLPMLASRIADGTLAVVHHDFAFLGQESYDAAVAAACADRQGRFWEVHDALYAAQQGENQGAFAASRLTEIAKGVGLDADAYAACTADRETLVEVLDETSAGAREGISSTPTIDVNGHRFQGVDDPSKLIAAIDAAAGGASPAPLPTAQPLADPWADVATDGRTAGSADAPVTVEMWLDYQAAGVSALPRDVENLLLPKVRDGTLRLERHDLAIHGEESEAAAATVRCVERGGGPGWLVHDVLAASGGQGTGQGLFVTNNLLRLASRLRLDVKAFDACLRDPAVTAEVRAETAKGRDAGYEIAPLLVVRKGDRETKRFAGTLEGQAVLDAVNAAAGR